MRSIWILGSISQTGPFLDPCKSIIDSSSWKKIERGWQKSVKSVLTKRIRIKIYHSSNTVLVLEGTVKDTTGGKHTTSKVLHTTDCEF